MLKDRPYQIECHDAHINYWASGGGNPLIVLPTGAGKSYQMAKFLKYSIDEYPGTRPLILAHVPELLIQNYQELLGIWPEAPAGIYSASVGKRDIHAQILFAGIQSIHRKAVMLQNIDYVLVDEAHTIPRKSSTMYKRFLDDLKKINPHLRVAGYTATEFRTDSGMLHEGPDAMFDGIAYKAEIKELMEAGYLSPLTSRPSDISINTENLPTVGGDFAQQKLEARALDPEHIRAVADDVLKNSTGRNGILVFGSGVKHAAALCEALRERGISSEAAFGDTEKGDRNRFVREFKSRRIRSLCCYGIFTTGFNVKHVDLIVMDRATKSRGLYIQIAGRGTRIYPGKENCLFLDYGGNIARHGPIDNMKPIKSKSGLGGTAPYKICPNCGEENHAVARACVMCGFDFPEPESKVATEASTLDIMSRGDQTPEWLDVSKVTYSRHSPRDTSKPNSLKVTYQCGLLWHSEWVCLEHSGHAKYKAVSWWKRRAPAGSDVPKTIGEALELTGPKGGPSNYLDEPRQIAVRPDGEFMSVTGHRHFMRDVAIAA